MVKPLPTVVVGMVGGVIVGLTSVGSGSLMIVLLLFLYPMISANRLVGTDLTQAVPLTAAAALGALAFGHVEFGVTISIVLGSVPAVLIGSLLSSRAPDKYIRPVITFVILASGLKYVGVPTKALGWTLGSVLLAVALAWVAVTLVRRRRAAALASDGAALALANGAAPPQLRPPGRLCTAAAVGGQPSRNPDEPDSRPTGAGRTGTRSQRSTGR